MKTITLKVYGRVDPKQEEKRRRRGKVVLVRSPVALPGNTDMSPKRAVIENGVLTMQRHIAL